MTVSELIDLINLGADGGNVSSTLSARLRELIIKDELPANYVFPGELVLCNALGISRGSLRESYIALEAEGLIERSRRGTVVRERSEIPQVISINTAMQLSDFNDLIEFRSIFESGNARLAALRATEEDIATLEYYLAMMKSNTRDYKKLTLYDMKFHLEVADITKNWLLRTTMEATKDTFSKGIFNAFDSDPASNVERALMYHQKLIDAIKNKNADEAERLMKEHVLNISSRGIGERSGL